MEESTRRAFVIASVAINRLLDRDLKEHFDLTTDDYTILVLLSEAPDRRLRFGELAAITRYPKAHITYRFQRLAERGLLEREDCETDARGAYAVVTDEGETMARRAGEVHADSVRRHLFDHLDGEQVRVLGEAMRSVLDAKDGLALPS